MIMIMPESALKKVLKGKNKTKSDKTATQRKPSLPLEAAIESAVEVEVEVGVIVAVTVAIAVVVVVAVAVAMTRIGGNIDEEEADPVDPIALNLENTPLVSTNLKRLMCLLLTIKARNRLL
jgi:hypothetical protein